MRNAMTKIRTPEEIKKKRLQGNFKEKAIFYQQADFMKSCGQTVDRNNTKQIDLYDSLIEEEYREFRDAIAVSNEAEEADAAIDLIVVLIGYGLSRGWPMKQLWDEVMTSNMAKIDPATGKVKKRRDGKVLKPKDWTPPNIKDILMRHKAKKKV